MLQLLEPLPRIQWPLALLSALDAGESVVACLSLSFTSGTLHFGTEDGGFDGLEDSGSVLGRIRSWPDFVSGFDPASHRLGLPRYVVEIEDGDGELAAVLRGAAQLEQLRVAATVRIGTDEVAVPLWATAWTGVMSEWGTLDRGAVRLTLRQNDGWLTQPILRHRIRRSEFPYARADALDQPMPLALGQFDSRSSIVPGAVPCLYVDTRTGNYRFMATLGQGFRVPRVYADGELQVETTDYTVTYTTINGYRGTWIEFVADPGEDVFVRCDLEGLDSEGDGTGATIQTPAMQLRHAVAQFGIAASRGTSLSDAHGDGALDARSLAEVDDYLQGFRRRPRGSTSTNQWRHGRRTRRYISSAHERVLDFVNDWCEEHGVYPYWNDAGKVAFAVLDHRTRRTYFERFRWVRDEDQPDETVQQHPLVKKPTNTFDSGVLSVRDTYSLLTENLESRARFVNRWSLEAIHEADLIPYDTTDEPTAWTIVSPGSTMTEPHEAIADPPHVPDDATTRATWDAGSATGTFRVRCRLLDAPQLPQAGTVAAVVVRARMRYVANGGGTHTAKAGLRINSTDYYGTERTLTTSWVTYEDVYLLNPDTTAAWAIEELNPDVIEAIVSATHTASQDKPEITQLCIRVFVCDGGAAAALVRERLSRAAALQSRNAQVTEGLVSMSRAAIRPGDPFSWSSIAGTSADGNGWGTETWERRLHFLCSRTLKLGDEKSALLRALDGRDLVVPVWETGMASALAPESQGIVRLGSWPAGPAGGADGRQFSRVTADDGDPTGERSITAPWGSSVTVQPDHEKYTDGGLLFEPLDTAPSPDRNPDILRYLFRHDAQPWPIEGGTAIFLVRPSTLATGTYTVMRCGSDHLYINGADDSVRFRRTVGGTDYEAASAASTVTEDEDVAIAIRWTPGIGGLTELDADELEVDKTPYTLDIWTATAASDPAMGTPDVAVRGYAGDLYIGSDAGSTSLNGHAKLWRAWRQLLSDDEIEAELEALT